ncbi:MAG: pyridoxine 5'-phosphate synthase [Oligoflexia bacterium]|nr:pyridoxine 5'-phosphate synthase [Oligoflexia bacterium]
MVRLGVNIDHVATIRQARGEEYPSIVAAARTCFMNGADQITIHLREDRRHIQDTDVSAVKLVTREFSLPLNLEMGCSDEIIKVAIESAPDWVCLVPENRQERTTEGGLNLLDKMNFARVKDAIKQLKSGLPNLKISLFIESNPDILKQVKELSAPAVSAVEIHTGDYARAFLNEDDLQPFFASYTRSREMVKEMRLGFHAGHGLTYESTLALLKKGFFEEFNIGHWIISESIFQGLGSVVKKLKEAINANANTNARG